MSENRSSVECESGEHIEYGRGPRDRPTMRISKRLEEAAKGPRNTDAARRVPLADATTFALIMRHHANQAQWEHVDYLERQLSNLQLQPNSALLNVLIHIHTQQGKYGQAWQTYKMLTNVPEGTPGVFPNGASFRHLWLSLRLALGDDETRHYGALPTPRELLAETLHWWEKTRMRSDAERFRIGLVSKSSGAVTHLIMHCFSYTKDLPGSLVALHALRKKLNIFPSSKAAEILQKQIAWVDLDRKNGAFVPQSLPIKRMFVQSVDRMARIQYILAQKRFKRNNITGDRFAYMSPTEAGDLELNLLSEFIRVILKRQHPPEVVEALINEAKQAIGLPELSTGDMDAFSVA